MNPSDPETTPAPVSPEEEFWRRVKLNDGWMWHADSYGSPQRTTKEEATRMDTPKVICDDRCAAPLPPPHEQWGTCAPPDKFSRGRMRLCLFGDRASAEENRDPDERLCRVRIEVLEVV